MAVIEVLLWLFITKIFNIDINTVFVRQVYTQLINFVKMGK
jgi:hypothetical protein